MNKKNKLLFNKNEESFQEQQKQEINEKIYECPRCNLLITVENNDIKIMEFDCPLCGQKTIFQLSLEQLEISQEERHIISWLSKINITALLIGLFIIFIGAFFLLQPNPLNIKLCITFLIIGIILPIFLIEKNKLSMKITFGCIVLIIILFLVTGTDLELFFILMFPGLFLIKIIIDNYIPASLRFRMNIVISAFFVIFIAFLVKRIINIVSV